MFENLVDSIVDKCSITANFQKSRKGYSIEENNFTQNQSSSIQMFENIPLKVGLHSIVDKNVPSKNGELSVDQSRKGTWHSIDE